MGDAEDELVEEAGEVDKFDTTVRWRVCSILTGGDPRRVGSTGELAREVVTDGSMLRCVPRVGEAACSMDFGLLILATALIDALAILATALSSPATALSSPDFVWSSEALQTRSLLTVARQLASAFGPGFTATVELATTACSCVSSCVPFCISSFFASGSAERSNALHVRPLVVRKSSSTKTVALCILALFSASDILDTCATLGSAERSNVRHSMSGLPFRDALEVMNGGGAGARFPAMISLNGTP